MTLSINKVTTKSCIDSLLSFDYHYLTSVTTDTVMFMVVCICKWMLMTLLDNNLKLEMPVLNDLSSCIFGIVFGACIISKLGVVISGQCFGL